MMGAWAWIAGQADLCQPEQGQGHPQGLDGGELELLLMYAHVCMYMFTHITGHVCMTYMWVCSVCYVIHV